MDSQHVLDLLPNIKGSAVKLLLHRVLTNGAFRSDQEIMQETGVTDRATYYAAKAKLKHLGWWENPTIAGRETRLLPVGKPYLVGKPDQEVVGKPDYPGRETLLPSRETRLVGKPDQLPRIVAATLDVEVVKPEEPDLRSEAMQLDFLPSDGLPNTPNSNYSKKRREQVAFLQKAWTHFFPKAAPLLPVNAKRMLSLTDDVAEDVLDRFEEVSAKGIESPLAYLMKVFEGTKNRPAPVGLKTVAIGKPERDEESGGISYMMDKPSAKTLAIEARARAMGRLKTEDDDE